MFNPSSETLHHKVQGLWIYPKLIWINPMSSIEGILNTILEPMYYAWLTLKSLTSLSYSMLTGSSDDMVKFFIDFISYLILSLMTAVTFGLVLSTRSMATIYHAFFPRVLESNQEDKWTAPVIRILGSSSHPQNSQSLEYIQAIEVLKEKAKQWDEEMTHINHIQAQLYEKINTYTQQLQWINQEIQDENKEYSNEILDMGVSIKSFDCHPTRLMQDYALLISEYPALNDEIQKVQSATDVTTIEKAYEQHHDKVKMFVADKFEKIMREIDALIPQNQMLIDQMQSFDKAHRYMPKGRY